MSARISLIIWLVSAVCNALLITACIGATYGGSSTDFWQSALYVMYFGFLLGLGFSLPAFIILTIVLSICEDRGLNSMQYLRVVIITSLALTAGTYFVITYLFNAMEADFLFLLYTSLASVAIGIACQWKAIKKISPDQIQPDSHEN